MVLRRSCASRHGALKPRGEVWSSVKRHYRKDPIVATLVILSELAAFTARYFRGVVTLGRSLFSGTKKHKTKLALALSWNEK